MFALSVLQAAGEKSANMTVHLIVIDALTKVYALTVMYIVIMFENK